METEYLLPIFQNTNQNNVCLTHINMLHSQEDGGPEESIVFDLDTYFCLEIAGSLITRGKHFTVMLGMGQRYWQPGSG